MATALLGKYFCLLALILLFYSCCCAFRIREAVLLGDQSRTASCSLASGKCNEKTIETATDSAKTSATVSSPRRKFDGFISQPTKTHKPPAMFPADDEDNENDDDDKDDNRRDKDSSPTKPYRSRYARVTTVSGLSSKGFYRIRKHAESMEENRSDKKEVTIEEDNENNDVDNDEVNVDFKKSVQQVDKKSSEYGENKKDHNCVEKDEYEDEIDNNKLTTHTTTIETFIRQMEERINERNDKFQMQGTEEGRKVISEEDSINLSESSSLEKADDSDKRKIEEVRYADKDKYKQSGIISKKLVNMKQKAELTELSEHSEKMQEVEKHPPPKPKAIKVKTESTKPLVKTKSREILKYEEKEKISAKTDPSSIRLKSNNAIEQSYKSKSKAIEVKLTSNKPKMASINANKTKSKQKKSPVSSISLTELNDAILQVPTFAPNFTAVANSLCQQHGKIFLRQLRGYRLWALQMLDATAKVPSGLLRGNINQLGDFDECLGITARVKVNEKTVRIQGKYCLANIDLHGFHPDMKMPVNLMQARAFIRSNIRDPEHFIPRYTTANWALCLPAVCSATDAEKMLIDGLSHYNVSTGLRFTVNVEPNMCYVKQRLESYSKETIGVLYFYAMIICLVIIATVRDYMLTLPGKGNYSERIIMAFSLRKTMRILLKHEESNSNEITCIHGIRAVCTIALYIAHQLIPISKLPFSNRVSITEVSNNPISSVLRVSLVYTDCFLLLSGVLTAYHMSIELKTRGQIRWFCRSVARFIRLTPALLVVIFWYAFIMEHTGSGPMWNSVIKVNADLCKRNAWTNFLYVQNFFPFEEMCATHTHQLALDMQLSLFVPILVFLLYYKPIIGALTLVFIILLSATLRYVAVMHNYLSLVIFHGMSVKHLYKTANLTYVLPLHRATPYVFGIGLGALLTSIEKNPKIHKIFMILGWVIAISLGSWSLFSPWRLAKRDYIYNAEEATYYAVIGPISWAAFLSWTIFACFTDHRGIVNKILSNYWLVVFSRISYAVYLTQFAVFFYNVGVTRYSTQFQIHRAIDPFEAATVVSVSVILTLLFDLPMQEVKNVVMQSTDIVSSESASADEIEDDDKINQQGTGKDPQYERIILEDRTREDITHRLIRLESVISEDAVEREELNGAEKSFIGRNSPKEEEILTWHHLGEGGLLKREPEIVNRFGIDRISKKLFSHNSEEENIGSHEYYRDDKHTKKRISSGNKADSKLEDENRSEHLKRLENGEISSPFGRPESRGRIYVRDFDPHSWESIRTERSSSRVRESNRSLDKTDDASEQQIKDSTSKSVEPSQAFLVSNEAETVHKKKSGRHIYSSIEPEISGEKGWKEELRIRRRQFTEKRSSQEREYKDKEEDLRRRSSAEGKIALLTEPTGNINMDSWTVSRVSHISHLGSSQEPSDLEDDELYEHRAYHESAPSFRIMNQSEEESSWDNSRKRSYTSGSPMTTNDDEEDVSIFDFVLRKESKRISFQDLSKLSQEESELENSGWNLVKMEGIETFSTPFIPGLIKRESIIKSQASEEDPEYILPERPKLVEQEQEHPFKKAWQMQKSRSEEDYSVKESKQQPDTIKNGGESQLKESNAGTEITIHEPQVVEERLGVSSASQDKLNLEDSCISNKNINEKSYAADLNRDVPTSSTNDGSYNFNWPIQDLEFKERKRECKNSQDKSAWDMEQGET